VRCDFIHSLAPTNLNRDVLSYQFSTEVDGGHLGSVSGGMTRTAEAFLVLMAQIAGWRP
jgi:hypothetical protein